MRRSIGLILVLSTIALLITWLGGVRHDYGDYLKQWALVLTGDNPWSTNNAYGPLHNAFALLVPLHPLLPKLATAASLMLANALLLRALLKGRPFKDWRATYFIALAANVLVLISAFWFGLNDAFVAALILGAILARLENRLWLAGLFLGLATLEKYYPALLIPFFALDARTIQPRLLVATGITIIAGIGLAVWIWGSAYFEAIAFGISRDATILSVLRPVVVAGRALGFGDAVDLLVRFNTPLVVLVWLIALAAAWVRRDNWLVGACWGLFALLLTYKVGNPQFWISWLALVAALPLINAPTADRLARLSWPFALFLGLFQIGYVVLQPQYYQGQWLWVNDVVGLPSFALGLWLLIAFLRDPTPSRSSG